MSNELMNLLTQSAVNCGAIEKWEPELLIQRGPMFSLPKLINASGYSKNRELREALDSHKSEVMAILSSDKEQAGHVAGLLSQIRKRVEENERALVLAKENRHRIHAKKLLAALTDYGRKALSRAGITDGIVLEVAGRTFAEFSKHVLGFTPNLHPGCDPTAGPQLWMFSDDDQYKDWLLETPVSYVWPQEAHFLAHAKYSACDEQTLRAALLCLQSNGSEYSGPLVEVDGSGDGPEWPCWPPEHGPYTLRPPHIIETFLGAARVGAVSNDTDSIDSGCSGRI